MRAHAGTEGPGYNGEQIEIVFLLEGVRDGRATCKFGSREHPVPTHTGTAWVCPAEVRADEIRTTRSPLMAGHIYIPQSSLDAVASDEAVACRKPVLRSAATPRDTMIDYFGRTVLAEMERETSAGRLLADAAVTMLSAHLLQNYAEFTPASIARDQRRPLDPSRLSRVVAHIEHHLDDDISLASLARVACMSAFHFSRSFAAAIGVPPHRYVSQLRLERAKSEIVAGKVPLAEIALRSGFSSQSAFTRAFRRRVGLSPGEYRRSLRG
ncbi:helix-turn-helix transcriptional regulator [Xanthobacter dioxanivorans]|uniref:Helix-turn-helix transcriptional regulator n=1 Tax=Xanthobacter dioxanivorans TaxID=2528964 RepID=A0A974PPD4_9HYPH|nr:AraC family transcriptional regulator [Xanthobacter dioxanivorans]QRG07318.1 helix-turn-helix transcriptional regulator [Xanthobacter dioxanivorans]